MPTGDQVRDLLLLLYPWLPLTAFALMIADVMRTPDFANTSSSHPERAAFQSRVDGWSATEDEISVHWLDHAHLPKTFIVETAQAAGWYYRGQDMRAHGWPLHFTRDFRERGVFDAERKRYQAFQERNGARADPDATGPPTERPRRQTAPGATPSVLLVVAVFLVGLPVLLISWGSLDDQVLAWSLLIGLLLIGFFAVRRAVAIDRRWRARQR